MFSPALVRTVLASIDAEPFTGPIRGYRPEAYYTTLIRRMLPRIARSNNPELLRSQLVARVGHNRLACIGAEDGARRSRSPIGGH